MDGRDDAAVKALDTGIVRATPESVGFCPARLRHLDTVLQDDVDAGKLPGGVLTVARHGKLVHASSFGKLDPRQDEPMRADAIFRIYSMTKPIVSVALMMLVEQGQLLLSQPAAKWLPELADLVVLGKAPDGSETRLPPGRPVTVQDLLRHTAGFTYEFSGQCSVHRQYTAARLFSRSRSNADFTQALAQIPLLHSPGTAWAYSHSTDVVGRLIEVVSGQSLGAFLQSRIFGPLGMVDTGFHVPESQAHRMAEPFRRDPDSGAPVLVFDLRKPVFQEMAGAGLASTAADYARFMQMMLSGGVLGGVRLLSPSTVRRMTADHLGAIPVTGTLLAPGHGFGLGFAVRLATGVAEGAGSAGMYYWGGLAGTSFFIDPAEGLHAQLMIQQPGRRDHYRDLFRELVYAAIVE
jgi:CubicO group peptidase (beta-lactamase class C family)